MPNWPQFRGDAGAWPAAASEGTDGSPAVPHLPLPGWPAQGTVEYLTKLILLGLLLLALPYLLGRLIFHPGDLMEAATARAMRGAL